jgi:hypothetical protein
MKEVSHGLETFLQQVINGLSLGSVYALIAVGYSLVYSVLLFSNFAHGGFLVVGCRHGTPRVQTHSRADQRNALSSHRIHGHEHRH